MANNLDELDLFDIIAFAWAKKSILIVGFLVGFLIGIYYFIFPMRGGKAKAELYEVTITLPSSQTLDEASIGYYVQSSLRSKFGAKMFLSSIYKEIPNKDFGIDKVDTMIRGDGPVTLVEQVDNSLKLKVESKTELNPEKIALAVHKSLNNLIDYQNRLFIIPFKALRENEFKLNEEQSKLRMEAFRIFLKHGKLGDSDRADYISLLKTNQSTNQLDNTALDLLSNLKEKDSSIDRLIENLKSNKRMFTENQDAINQLYKSFEVTWSIPIAPFNTPTSSELAIQLPVTYSWKKSALKVLGLSSFIGFIAAFIGILFKTFVEMNLGEIKKKIQKFN